MYLMIGLLRRLEFKSDIGLQRYEQFLYIFQSKLQRFELLSYLEVSLLSSAVELVLLF